MTTPSMSPRLSHSEKALLTLRLMGCDTNGWRVPDVRWERVLTMVPTVVRCSTCRGTGQVDNPDAPAERRFASRMRCPACPPRRRATTYGTGEVIALRERAVEAGIIQWPAGTRFDSRFGSGCHCALCGKRITSAVPVLGLDADGVPHGMWVGSDCGRTIIGVAGQGITLEIAADRAADAKERARLWREIPKAPKPVKPPTPELTSPASQAELEAIVRDAFGDAVRYCSYDRTRAELRFSFTLEATGARPNGMPTYEVKVSARHGVTVRHYGSEAKPLLKDRARQDAVGALRDALPAIRAHAGR